MPIYTTSSHGSYIPFRFLHHNNNNRVFRFDENAYRDSYKIYCTGPTSATATWRNTSVLYPSPHHVCVCVSDASIYLKNHYTYIYTYNSEKSVWGGAVSLFAAPCDVDSVCREKSCPFTVVPTVHERTAPRLDGSLLLLLLVALVFITTNTRGIYYTYTYYYRTSCFFCDSW